MEKRNELRAGVSVCDICSKRADLVSGHAALCREHAGQAAAKTAGSTPPLKSASPSLKDRFDEGSPDE
jgi:hypothetical protein